MVLGATGLVGRAVTKQLMADGFDVCVVSRSGEKVAAQLGDAVTCVQCDATKDEEILRSALSEVDGLFIALPDTILETAMPGIMAGALLARVQHVVYISGNTVCAENAWHPMIKGHYAAECCIEKSGLPYTILKPTMIMDTIPMYANKGRAFLIGRQPNPWRWIHTADIARYASKSFQTAQAVNRRFSVLGKDAMSIPKAVEAFNRVHFPGAKSPKGMPFAMARILALFIGANFRLVVDIFKYFDTHTERIDDGETIAILGSPRVGLHEFIADYNA